MFFDRHTYKTAKMYHFRGALSPLRGLTKKYFGKPLGMISNVHDPKKKTLKKVFGCHIYKTAQICHF